MTDPAGVTLLSRKGPFFAFWFSDMPVILKVFNLVAAVMFAIFSMLQWNDLDPAVYADPSSWDAVAWTVFYAFVAVLFILVSVRRLPRWVLLLGLVLCVIQMGRTAPGLWENLSGDRPFTMTQAGMSADDPRVELSREFFGALIALVGVGIVAFENARAARTVDGPADA